MENLEWNITDEGLHRAIFNGRRVADIGKGYDLNPMVWRIVNTVIPYCNFSSENLEEIKTLFEKSFALWYEHTLPIFTTPTKDEFRAIG